MKKNTKFTSFLSTMSILAGLGGTASSIAFFIMSNQKNIVLDDGLDGGNGGGNGGGTGGTGGSGGSGGSGSGGTGGSGSGGDGTDGGNGGGNGGGTGGTGGSGGSGGSGSGGTGGSGSGGDGTDGGNGGGTGGTGGSGGATPSMTTIKFSLRSLQILMGKLNEWIYENKYSWIQLEGLLMDPEFVKQFKQLIVEWTNGLITFDSIGEIKFAYDGTTVTLLIKSSDGYKYDSNSVSPYLDRTNSTLTFADLEYATNVTFFNSTLNSFKTKLQRKILNEQYTPDEFATYVSSNDFKTYLSQNLTDIQNNLVSIDNLGDSTYNTQTGVLTINSSDTCKFNLFENSQNNYVNSISLSSFSFYSVRTLVNLNKLKDAIENEISKEQLTEEEFASYVASHSATMREIIANNLFVSENNTISASEIKSVTFDNNSLLVTLTPPSNQKYSIGWSNDFSLNNNILTIRNLSYVQKVTLSRLSVLKDAIQNKITSNKFSTDDFVSYLQNNQQEAKELISSNLYISNSTKIDPSIISSVSYDNGAVAIKLTPPKNTKYEKENVSFANYSNNTLTIYNIRYFHDLKLSNLNGLFDAIQNEITSKQFTAGDLKDYISTQTGLFKYLISINLNIYENEHIDINKILNVNVVNNNLEITLDTSNNTKYSLGEQNSNMTIVNNNKLVISNLTYFSETKFVNTTLLFNEIQNIITNNQFTSSDFSKYIKDDKETFKQTIASNLRTSDNTTFDVSSIQDIVYVAGNIQVSFTNQNGHKYTVENNLHMILENNVLQISGFSFWKSRNLTNLNNLHSKIQSIIYLNGFDEDGFKTYVNDNQITLRNTIAQNLYVVNNPIPSGKISTISFANNNLVINLLPDEKTKFTITSNNNFEMNGNALIVKNLVFDDGLGSDGSNDGNSGGTGGGDSGTGGSGGSGGTGGSGSGGTGGSGSGGDGSDSTPPTYNFNNNWS